MEIFREFIPVLIFKSLYILELPNSGIQQKVKAMDLLHPEGNNGFWGVGNFPEQVRPLQGCSSARKKQEGWQREEG